MLTHYTSCHHQLRRLSVLSSSETEQAKTPCRLHLAIRVSHGPARASRIPTWSFEPFSSASSKYTLEFKVIWGQENCCNGGGLSQGARHLPRLLFTHDSPHVPHSCHTFQSTQLLARSVHVVFKFLIANFKIVIISSVA